MLDSLLIKNFRCLQDFRVERLGRLNLIVGGNNSGKSTVLEALQIFCTGASEETIAAITSKRNEPQRETTRAITEADSLPYSALFPEYQMDFIHPTPISIGNLHQPENTLTIQPQLVAEQFQSIPGFDGLFPTWVALPANHRITGQVTHPALEIRKGGPNGQARYIVLDQPPLRRLALMGDRLSVPCQVVSTRVDHDALLATDWDDVVSTEREDLVYQALRIISPNIVSLGFVRASDSNRLRRAIVRINGISKPVSLGSLGEGIGRILQIILKLVNARDGLLLIDEFENGLHYSVQPKVWAMLFELAEKLNVQVFATTHSWDCIKAFSEVAKANEQVDGVLFRMGRSARTSNKGQVIATVYDEQALNDMTQADLELR